MEYCRKFADNFLYSARLIRKVSKGYFAGRLVLLMAGLFLDYGLLFLWRDILNRLTVNDVLSSDVTTVFRGILMLVGLYAALTLVRKLLASIGNIFMYRFQDEISYFLDSVLIDKTADCDISFFDSPDARFTLKLSEIYIHNPQSMAEFFFGFLDCVTNLTASVVLLCSLHPVLAPVILLTSIPAIAADYRARKSDRDFDRDYRIYDEKMEGYCDYFFDEDSRNEIRLNNSGAYIMKLYNEAYGVWDAERSARDKRKFCGDAAGKIMLFAGEAVMYLTAVIRLIEGAIGIGDVTYYVSLLTSFRGAYMGMFSLFVEYDDVSEKVSRIREVLDKEPVVEKGGEAVPLPLPEICFEDVSFRYPGAKTDVLSHCSFTIHRGETVGLVGLNGAGKSTILKLMCRFYDPTGGRILIDEKDAREYDIVSLRELFGVLFQDYVNYSFTLRENVAMSDLSRMEDTAAIIEACQKSRAYDFISGWEKGIDENMTRRFDPEGKELSGGQWQRVALARAFFRDAPVIFLDEPSASLDPVAEEEIFQEFARLSGGKSAVLISHRLSSITLADRVLVLEDGQIVEEGSHDELMEKGGRYAYLFGLQAGKYM